MRQVGRSNTRERILEFIHGFFDEHGYAPTVRDILRGCSISSTAVVQHHLDVLEREGRIQRDPEVFRSIRLADRKTLVTVPLLGVIAAGEPIPVPSTDAWTSQALDTLDLPPEFAGGRQVFALKVKGQSMIDALIDDGDIVIMEPVGTAVNGQMVAVWLKDERAVTLKRIYVAPDKVTLQPANPLMPPITSRPENVEIQGRVVGVLRKLS
jgi:repressor LexA